MVCLHVRGFIFIGCFVDRKSLFTCDCDHQRGLFAARCGETCHDGVSLFCFDLFFVRVCVCFLFCSLSSGSQLLMRKKLVCALARFCDESGLAGGGLRVPVESPLARIR